MSQHLVLKNFINGDFVECRGLFIDSFNPSTGKVWARVPDSGPEEVELAVGAARRAFPLWSSTPAKERSRILMKIADILETRLEEFATVESRDQGKPVSLARRMDIPRAVYNCRFFATAILHHLDTSSRLEEHDAFSYSTRLPVGVAGLIAPWNLPLYLLTFKLAPAIVTGNVVVAKPSEMTSVTAWMLCKVFQDAGLPPGVVNMVFGTGPRTGDAIVKHPDVGLISFTGSSPTAEKIRIASAPFSKKLSLELGGKNAAIVFADCHIESCVTSLTWSAFANQGEICLCSSRIFVQDDIFDDFLEKFVNEARKLTVGDPRDPEVKLGALISQEHLEKVRGYVRLARKEGATVHCGGDSDVTDLGMELSDGYFMRPTIITGVQDSSRLMKEEIFGPVVCVVPFSTEEEVVSRANNTQYGLSASLWTASVDKTHRVAQKLEVGTVWVNCWLVRDLNMPFGGMKNSGIGREGFQDSIDFFTETKTVCIKMHP